MYKLRWRTKLGSKISKQKHSKLAPLTPQRPRVAASHVCSFVCQDCGKTASGKVKFGTPQRSLRKQKRNGMTFMTLLNITDDQQATLDFLLERGMIEGAPVRHHCGAKAKLVYETNKSGNLKPAWMSRAKLPGAKQHKFTRSVLTNSFFKGSKLDLQRLLRIIYCFAPRARMNLL